MYIYNTRICEFDLSFINCSTFYEPLVLIRNSSAVEEKQTDSLEEQKEGRLFFVNKIIFLAERWQDNILQERPKILLFG